MRARGGRQTTLTFGEGVHADEADEPREGGEGLGVAESLPERAGLVGSSDFANEDALELESLEEQGPPPDHPPIIGVDRPDVYSVIAN